MNLYSEIYEVTENLYDGWLDTGIYDPDISERLDTAMKDFRELIEEVKHEERGH